MQVRTRRCECECHGRKQTRHQLRDYCLGWHMQTYTLAARGVRSGSPLRVRPPKRDFGDFQPADISVGREASRRQAADGDSIRMGPASRHSALDRLARSARRRWRRPAFEFEHPFYRRATPDAGRRRSETRAPGLVPARQAEMVPSADAGGGTNRRAGRGAWAEPAQCGLYNHRRENNSSDGALRLQRSIEARKQITAHGRGLIAIQGATRERQNVACCLKSAAFSQDVGERGESVESQHQALVRPMLGQKCSWYQPASESKRRGGSTRLHRPPLAGTRRR